MIILQGGSKTMRNRKLTAVLAGVMLASVLMTGCGNKAMDAGEVVATVGEENVSLGLANFSARIQQAQAETYYKPYLGDDMWNQDMGGKTYEAAVKDSIMEMLKEYYIVKNHASEYGVELTAEDEQKIADAAAKFMAENSKEAIAQMTASEDVLSELLELMTIRSRVYLEVVKDADTTVSDEEAAQKKVEYVFVSTADYVNDEKETVSYTDEEKAQKKALAADILAKAQETGDFEAAVTEQELTMSNVTYGGDVSTTLPDEVKEAADALQEGEYTDVVETTGGYYVARLASAFDTEATEERKAQIIEQKESDFYMEVYEAWAEEVEFTVNEDVWAKVNFQIPMTIKTGAAQEAEKDAEK